MLYYFVVFFFFHEYYVLASPYHGLHGSTLNDSRWFYCSRILLCLHTLISHCFLEYQLLVAPPTTNLPAFDLLLAKT